MHIVEPCARCNGFIYVPIVPFMECCGKFYHIQCFNKLAPILEFKEKSKMIQQPKLPRRKP